MDILFLIGRILFGGLFVLNGIKHLRHLEGNTSYAASKRIPSPQASVIITGLMLLLGGIGVVFGVYVTVALWLLIIFLVPTSFLMHAYWKVSPEERMAEQIQFTKNLALAGAALMLLSFGEPWPLSL